MRLVRIVILLSLCLCLGCRTEPPAGCGIIPRPVEIEYGRGSFVFSPDTRCRVENADQKELVSCLSGLFEKAADFSLQCDSSSSKADLSFVTDSAMADEEYVLDIKPKDIIVKARSTKGFFYALMSLRQLLPADIEKSTSGPVSELEIGKEIKWSVPSVSIHDKPRFEYRGLMLDVARYFIPKDEVLKIIDLASMLKINKLHLHLVDDHGWRLEIRKYPRLTSVGAWRVERDNPFPARRNPVEGEPTPVGGFYTQDDIREIVSYAALRQMEVIPEIEMPAHTVSSLAAYPSLACPVVKDFIGVLPGLGGFSAAAIYCAGNDAVFEFLEGVIDEVVELFPSEYVHLGGDEAVKDNWKKCPLCQKRMRDNSLADEEELQGYFMERVASYVRSKGKRVIGWDDLTNSALPEDAIIFGWQGGGSEALKAAAKGHEFVLTPAKTLYLIRYQGPQWFEPLTYFGNNTLKDVYDYEPVQSDWPSDYAGLLKGVQASLWTEFCSSPADVEYLVFPRLAALAEVAWSPSKSGDGGNVLSGNDGKDWHGFLSRLDGLCERWDLMGVSYARSMFNLNHKVTPRSGDLLVELSCIRPDVEIRYTLDGSEPDASSALYDSSLSVRNMVACQEVKSLTVRAATFKDGERAGAVLTLPLSFNLATGCQVSADDDKKLSYVLTNGLRGSSRQSDFEWAGWYDKDGTVVVDLGGSKHISKVAIGLIADYGMAVHLPERAVVSVSDDGETFRQLGEKTYSKAEIFKECPAYTTDLTFNGLDATASFLKINLFNPGLTPPDHVRPSLKVWMYADEVVVE